ncbi:MAG: PAS domain-containing protein [Candidatus Eremiobacteraeota bacterium]|nr:PAS domain-containing protein [Candidatus Eremiobacteraeota bacterium]
MDNEKAERLGSQLESLYREIDELAKSKSALRHRITELKRELANNKTLMDSLPHFVSYKNREREYVSCNRSYARFLRIESDEIAGKTDHYFYPAELAKKLEDFDRKVIGSGKSEEFDEAFMARGHEILIRMVKVPVYDEEDAVAGILSISWDITERMRAERAIQQAREFSESIVDTIREPLLILDETMHILKASRSFYGTFGVAPEETVGKCIYDLGSRQWDIPRLHELLEHIIPEALSFENYEVACDFPVIGRRIMLLNARRIFRELNHSKIILLAIEDITDRVEAENKLKETREEFLATLTHDMKSPLSAMLGYLELMEKPQFGPLPEKAARFPKIIRCLIDSLLAMIHNIMHSSVIETGMVSYSMEDFPLDALLRELHDTYESLTLLSAITLNFKCPEGVWVRADREKIRAVFSNLLINSFRYTPPGGTISVTVLPADDRVLLKFTDTGKGIALSEQGKLFQKFIRIKGECRGTGLGLYTVKNTLEGHGSGIEVRSSPGEGTSFTFSLESGSVPEKKPQKSHLILVVSDEESGPHIIREALAGEGYQVDFVRNMEGVLEKISSPEQNPSLILVYHGNTNITVEELRSIIQEKIALRKIPVILISLLDLHEWESTFSALIPMPLDIPFLKEQIRKIIA